MIFLIRNYLDISKDILYEIQDKIIEESYILFILAYSDRYEFQPLSVNEYPIIEYDDNIKLDIIISMLNIIHNIKVDIEDFEKQIRILFLIRTYFGYKKLSEISISNNIVPDNKYII